MTQQFENTLDSKSGNRNETEEYFFLNLCVCVMFADLVNQVNYGGFGTFCKLSLSLCTQENDIRLHILILHYFAHLLPALAD